eukprot:gnl/Spiro4/22394_TR11033_c0_g1_i1.p1 gnl/Spiro4/22394_TR11033_c0_g1~~gnl/Spiro4/22394_TR11033_c0_g1_i1.p1  ORF type:complete len:179 (-),score=28.73 gnl/Spiro4/22394_TR11033_c0_g1_i1:53-589(-)
MDPESVINNPDIERQWAMKAFQHAEVYDNMLASRRPFSLTRLDDDIYGHFRRIFPSVRVDQLDQDELKNPEAKIVWREFCMEYEHTITDFNFATLIRPDCRHPCGPENSFIVPRIQFLALEIARAREGCYPQCFPPSSHTATPPTSAAPAVSSPSSSSASSSSAASSSVSSTATAHTP